MEKNFSETLREIVEEHQASELIFLSKVISSLSERTGLPPSRVSSIARANLSGMTRKDVLRRFERGVYMKTVDGVFGKTTRMTQNQYWLSRLLVAKGSPIGYLTGPTALNNTGLSTMVPAARHIATNRYRIRLPQNTQLALHKPLTSVDAGNVRYVQFLHLLQAVRRYHVDAENPTLIFVRLVQQLDLNPLRLESICQEIGTKSMLHDLIAVLQAVT